MKNFLAYLRLCIKKASKSFLAVTLTVLILAGLLALCATVMINTDKNDVSRQKVKIGVAGDTEGTHLGLGFEAIAQADEISFSVDFIEMTQEEAEMALAEFEISAYVLVPPNYVSSMVKGEDAVLTFVMSKSSADVSAVLMSEVAQVLSPLVTDSESGIYAMMDYGYDNDADGMADKITRLNLKYITEILDRSSAFEMRNLGIDTLSTAEYYVCGIITFFLLIFSVACCPLFADKNLPLGRLLVSKGTKVWQISACEYLSYLSVLFLSVTLLSVGGGVICQKIDLGIDPSFAFGLPMSLFPCVLMISAMQFAVYELTFGIISGVLAQFVLAAALGYISGCFYPYYMFPQSIQTVASVLPSGITFELLRDDVALRESNPWWICLLYTAAFLMLAVIARRKRLSEETA